MEAATSRHEGQPRALESALVHIAENWRLTNDQLGAVLGLSAATASRLCAGRFCMEQDSKAFELGQYLLRLFQGLDALMGSDDAASISWLKTANRDLAGRPLDLIRTVGRLSEVTHYVEQFCAGV